MLNTREVTQAMHDANRANSQKSTGPRTEKGKRNSRRNAFKHGLDSHELCPWAEELAEDSSQYRSFHRRFLQAFQVSDPVEALLVSDLARTQWRLDRVLHAESAYLAYHCAKLDNDFRRKLAGEGVDIRAAFENILVREAGYKSLADSEISLNSSSSSSPPCAPRRRTRATPTWAVWACEWSTARRPA